MMGRFFYYWLCLLGYMDDCEDERCVCKLNGAGQCSWETECSESAECPQNFYCSYDGYCKCDEPNALVGRLCIKTTGGPFDGKFKLSGPYTVLLVFEHAHIHWSLTWLTYTYCYWGDNTQMHHFAQSDSMSGAAKIFTQNLMCLIQ